MPTAVQHMGRLHGDGLGVLERLPGRAAHPAFQTTAQTDRRCGVADPEFRRYAAQVKARDFNAVDLDRAAKRLRRTARLIDFRRIEIDPVFAVRQFRLDAANPADALGGEVRAPWRDVDDAEIFAADVHIARLDPGELAVAGLALLHEVVEQAALACCHVAADHAAHEIGFAGRRLHRGHHRVPQRALDREVRTGGGQHRACAGDQACAVAARLVEKRLQIGKPFRRAGLRARNRIFEHDRCERCGDDTVRWALQRSRRAHEVNEGRSVAIGRAQRRRDRLAGQTLRPHIIGALKQNGVQQRRGTGFRNEVEGQPAVAHRHRHRQGNTCERGIRLRKIALRLVSRP
ncbi:hypothetical protein E6W36_05855 [Hankyongella ginsenosidimutans]|uniref:Uncharacterized protein n=1 Tax=Hankyongella ginsenosidimutans TaxID=1763828 RepID=A0A4D7C6A0_9SPHN|nr:hypothetical protein [Hankyongella ginsenosidimutans]QCI79255.1 hypothetical protein E6W36_05855 [Hankyongella ginsenosidimutans]